METSSIGKESFRVRVRTVGTDPTTGTVEFAFPETEVAPAAWTAGAWPDPADYNAASEVYEADAQTPTVGDGATGATVDLNPGTFDVWVRISTAGEVIVRRIDTLTVI